MPETMLVTQAAALQDDLRRAHIEPWACVIHKSLAATGTVDTLLQARVANGLFQRCATLPWLPAPLVGIAAMSGMTRA